MNTKIFIITASLDDGMPDMWHFRASDQLSVAQYILSNPDRFEDFFEQLGVDSKHNLLTPHSLLHFIENAYVDGDSAYGFEINEINESEIMDVPTVQVTPSDKLIIDFISDEQFEQLAKVKFHYRDKYPKFDTLFEQMQPFTSTEHSFLEDMKHFGRRRLMGEDSLLYFIQPMIEALKPFKNELFHNLPLQTTFHKTLPVETTIDFGILSNQSMPNTPVFIMENNWHRPRGVRFENVIMAKKLIIMNNFPAINQIWGLYFANSMSPYFTILNRQTDGSFEFHQSENLYIERDIEKIVNAFKFLLND